MSAYEVPKVWKWEEENSKKGGNRPTAGSRFEQTLPVGETPFQLYSLGTPNGINVTIMFEELKELGVVDADYDLYKINIGKGDQLARISSRLIRTRKFQPLLTKVKVLVWKFLNQVRFFFIWPRNLTS